MDMLSEVPVAEGRLYTIKEVAEIVNLTPNAVYQNARDGRLEYVRLGDREGMRVSGKSLKAWLESRKGKGRHDPWRESDRKVVIDGKLLYQRRRRWGWSMLEIARGTGVSPATLSRLESVNGPVRINWDTYNALFPIFGDLRPKGA